MILFEEGQALTRTRQDDTLRLRRTVTVPDVVFTTFKTGAFSVELRPMRYLVAL